ncbi:uncharacterized protein LOC130049884 isoform X2 [Ostrea edulis]|uniref:uncharacterized protein LOC130049884 isoform X2 n=1 Tax=Ostrea edulis TaxID=37623 RepID=UPI0024AF9847|nr:uncharacterized protein LOC130049884 isoform X2 [Ostrea edulis]
MAFNVLVVCLICLMRGTFATILNSGEIENGTCHLETFRADILLDYDVKDVLINIVTKDDDNMLVHCSTINDALKCFGAVYNESSNIMTFSTKFNHTKHAGKTMWVNTTCVNGTVIKDPVLLKPCVSGFTKEGRHHNTSHVTILCEHSSFKASDTGIHVHYQNNTLATCWSQQHACTPGATGLTNGVQYTTPYKPGMKFSCSLDGQNIPISVHEQTTNNPGSTSEQSKKGSGVRGAWSVFLTFALPVLVYILHDIST